MNRIEMIKAIAEKNAAKALKERTAKVRADVIAKRKAASAASARRSYRVTDMTGGPLQPETSHYESTADVNAYLEAL